MLSEVYNFSEIDDLRLKQKRLIASYILYVVCFIVAIGFACVTVKDNLLLTLIFASVLLFFIFYSIIFWKIKYGIIYKYKSFLEDIETGKSENFVGVFEEKLDASKEEFPFETYVFLSSDGRKEFLVYNHCSVHFEKRKKYHIENIGDYLCRWENIV